MTEKEKMLKGLPYDASDSAIRESFHKAKDLLKSYNGTGTRETEKRKEILGQLFGKAGNGVYVEPPFYCDYGENIYLGENVYMNVNCVILDCAKITIGSNVLFGPNVQIYAAGHPLQGKERVVDGKIVDFAFPVTIGSDVWIGGGAVILPGVTIGDNVVIGAGSVVTKNIPSNCVAVGNPARVVKPL
jgi:maltose O-acetyltransferase